jgi:flagellar biosynthesis chaperone FliJ
MQHFSYLDCYKFDLLSFFLFSSELAVKSKEKAEQSLKEKCNALQSLERQFTEMERANKKLMDDAHHHAQQL